MATVLDLPPYTSFAIDFNGAGRDHVTVLTGLSDLQAWLRAHRIAPEDTSAVRIWHDRVHAEAVRYVEDGAGHRMVDPMCENVVWTYRQPFRIEHPLPTWWQPA